MYIIRCSINLWWKMTSIRESESSRKDFCGEARREKPKTDELSLRRVFSICTFLRFSPTSQVKETRNRRRRNKKKISSNERVFFFLFFICVGLSVRACWWWRDKGHFLFRLVVPDGTLALKLSLNLFSCWSWESGHGSCCQLSILDTFQSLCSHLAFTGRRRRSVVYRGTKREGTGLMWNYVPTYICH